MNRRRIKQTIPTTYALLTVKKKKTYALLVAAAMTMVVVAEVASTSGNILQLHHTHRSVVRYMISN